MHNGYSKFNPRDNSSTHVVIIACRPIIQNGDSNPNPRDYSRVLLGL